MSAHRSDIAGLILAGGESKRMGRNKALLTVDGVPFVQRIVNTLHQRFSLILISANDSSQYAFLNLPVIPDVFKQCGPLAGIHAAFRAEPADYFFTVTCDIPFISIQVIDLLIDKIEEKSVVIADDGMQTHPLIGIYPRAIYSLLENYLREGKRQVHEFIETVDVIKTEVSPYARSVLNINTPDIYRREVGR